MLVVNKKQGQTTSLKSNLALPPLAEDGLPEGSEEQEGQQQQGLAQGQQQEQQEQQQEDTN